MKPKNVLFMISDQQRADTMRLYGNTFCDTPNLDALAADGLTFTRAYTPHATCTPSRASLLTGQYGSKHQGYTIGVNTPYDCVKVTEPFNEAGFATYACGKMHFRSCGTPGEFESPPHIFNETFFKSFKGPYFGFQNTQLLIGHTTEPHSAGMHYRVWLREHGFTDEDFKKHFHTWGDGSSPNNVIDTWGIPEELHPGAFITEASCAGIDAALEQDRPFFMWSCYQDPHIPFRTPEPYASMYMDADLPDYKFVEGEFDDKPPYYKQVLEEGWDATGWNTDIAIPSTFPDTLTDPEARRKRMAIYHGMVTLMDKQMGQVIDHLKKRGIYEETLIIFTTDHGDYMGSHGMGSKGLFPYEEVFNIPYIVRDPEAKNRGQQTEALHSHIDMAPTVLSRCGLEIPGVMQGVDQSDVYTGNKKAVRDCLKIENRPVHRGIYQKQLVTGNWKLVTYMGYPWGELYNMQTDRNQMENLWDNPDYQVVKAELLQRLVSYEMESEGQVPERTAFA